MKTFYTLSIFVFCCVVVVANAQIPQWLWAKDNYNATGFKVCTDKKANIYAVGVLDNGPSIFGNDTLINNYNGSMVLVKYDTAGNIKWARNATGFSNNGGFGVITVNGYVYVTGSFFGHSIVFGSDTLLNNDSTTYSAGMVFLVKYDSEGNVIWKRSGRAAGAEPGNQDYSLGISSDLNGNVFICGYFQTDSIMFGDTILKTVFQTNLFLVKYDSLGNMLWARTGSDFCGSNSVCTDADGNVYITGNASVTALPFNNPIPLSGESDAFVAKYDNLGNFVWAEPIAGGNSREPTGVFVCTDSKGNIYATGYSDDNMLTFGNVGLISIDDFNVYTVKYNASGEVLWAKCGGGNWEIESTCICVDANDNIYVTGSFVTYNNAIADTFTFQNTQLITSDCSIFLVEYDSSGNLIWTNSEGNTFPDDGNGLCADDYGSVYLTGSITDDTIVDFGNCSLINSPNAFQYFFLAKLHSDDNVTTSIDNLYFNPLVIYPNPTTGSVYFKGIQPGNTLQVYNLLGEEIYSCTITQDNYNINLAGRAKGMYFYRVTGATSIIQQGKIILQ